MYDDKNTKAMSKIEPIEVRSGINSLSVPPGFVRYLAGRQLTDFFGYVLLLGLLASSPRLLWPQSTLLRSTADGTLKNKRIMINSVDELKKIHMLLDFHWDVLIS